MNTFHHVFDLTGIVLDEEKCKELPFGNELYLNGQEKEQLFKQLCFMFLGKDYVFSAFDEDNLNNLIEAVMKADYDVHIEKSLAAFDRLDKVQYYASCKDPERIRKAIKDRKEKMIDLENEIYKLEFHPVLS